MSAGDIKWQANVAGSKLETYPAINPNGGTIYVAETFNGNAWYALDPSDGSVKWSKTVSGSLEDTNLNNALVYYEGSVFGGTRATKVIKRSASGGGLEGEGSTGSDEDTPDDSSPAFFSDGSFTIASDSNNVYGFSNSVNQNWTVSNAVNDIGAAVDTSDVAYYEGNSRAFAVRSDGSLKWDVSGYSESRGVAAITQDESTVIFPTSSGAVARSTSDGSQKWSVGSSDTGGIAIGRNNFAYFTIGSQLYKADANSGSVEWTYTANGGIAPPVVGAGGTVYWPTTGAVYAVTSEGNTKWSVGIDASDDQNCSPALDGNRGHLVVGDEGGTVYAIEISDAPAFGYADATSSSSPFNIQDVRNVGSGVNFSPFVFDRGNRVQLGISSQDYVFEKEQGAEGTELVNDGGSSPLAFIGGEAIGTE